MPRRSLRRKVYPKSHTTILYSTIWYTILPLYIDRRELIPKRSLRRKVYPKLHMGLVSYAKQLILLRFIGHMKFAHVKLDILKITMHSENIPCRFVGVYVVSYRLEGIFYVLEVKFGKYNMPQ
ncbi:uncharacterized protein LOC112467696 [Temnothorax curvispinosus]|uniref:Uncharacterized protein LOC112467696 n=1 Tax=Temnothorax curvispinosus TaxID=300111 RepID=A0A6J1RAY5_9HYME|nr:uncharacterized protein LOC112467696 [Temnothorax curvispinosus]